MNIKGNKVSLRAIEKSDCELITSMFNDKEIENLVQGWSFPISQNAQEHWIENHYNDSNNLHFVIDTDSTLAVGIAILTDIDWKNGNCSFGFKLKDKAVRGKGIGTDTLMALLRYSFDELRLHRVNSNWLDYNAVSQAVHKKCGFTIEGKQRELIYKNGAYHDLILSGITREEYYSLIKQNHYWDK
jgi:RimJ/RimL family protein N-acetyltransferase